MKYESHRHPHRNSHHPQSLFPGQDPLSEGRRDSALDQSSQGQSLPQPTRKLNANT